MEVKIPDTKCPHCRETLSSHANRGYKYFHQVAFGPYDGRSSGRCPLDGMAFEQNGTPIIGSDEARKLLIESIHGKKQKQSDEEVADKVRKMIAGQ